MRSLSKQLTPLLVRLESYISLLPYGLFPIIRETEENSLVNR